MLARSRSRAMARALGAVPPGTGCPSKGGACPHMLAAGYTKVIKEVIPMPHELITVKVKDEGGNPPKKQKGGRGNGRGRGRGGRGDKKY